MKTTDQVIVIGGGLSGLSAAHTALEHGFKVVLLERNAFCGGNSTKATSGINGALTTVQKNQGIQDSKEAFLRDTALSASKGKSDVPHELAKVLVDNSASAVEWLINKFGLDLTILGRLGGHSYPRTHRGPKRFPGMEITYALMKAYEVISEKSNSPARLLTKCRATSLIKENDHVIGVCYTDSKGVTKEEFGAVVIATGGFGADFEKTGILAKVRPDLLHLPTTNGPHCTGDGIKMARAVGGGDKDLAHVQVHPTGLFNPAEPKSKTLYLAAEALRGCGALMLDREGFRFCDELGRRDYVSGEMFSRDKAPYRLVLNGKASKEIDWHCKHYTGRGLMKHFKSGQELANEMGISLQTLKDTFDKYNQQAENKKDPFGKKFFANTPFVIDDYFYVAIVTPVIHYCMGGIYVSPDANVLTADNKKIPGLFASGEVIGGVHGINRLGGSSLLDCVVYGRVAGDSAAQYLNSLKTAQSKNAAQISSNDSIQVSIKAGQNKIDIFINSANDKAESKANFKADVNAESKADLKAEKNENQKEDEKNAETLKKEEDLPLISIEEVSKHTTEDDCWIVVNGIVLNATSFLDEHPGGKKAIMMYAGKDATEEFNMLHEPDVVEKYAPEIIIGRIEAVDTKSKL